MIRTSIALAAGVSLLALGGCRTTTNDNVPPGARADGVATPAYPAITVERPLQQYVAVDYDAIRVTPWDGSSPMRVTVPLRSTAYEQLAIQYRFLWYDADGNPVNESGWTFAALEPGLQSFLEGRATTSAAAKYRVEVRSAR